MSELYDAQIPKEYQTMVNDVVTKFSKEASLIKRLLSWDESWGWVLARTLKGISREIVVAAKMPFFKQPIFPRVESLLIIFPRIFVQKNSQVFGLSLDAELFYRKVHPLIVPIPSSEDRNAQRSINEGIRDIWQVVQNLSIDHATEPHFL